MVMWNFSALHPILCWGPAPARTAEGNMCAQTHQLLLVFWLIPVHGCSWQKPSKRGGRADGKYVTCLSGGKKISCCSPNLRAISEKGTDSEGFLLMLKGRNKPCRQHYILFPLLKSSPWCPLQGSMCCSLEAPFPRWAGGTPSAQRCLQPTGH